MKVEQRYKEEAELQDKPLISEYSRYIASRNRSNVFERLTSPNYKREREIETMKKNHELNNSFKPEISVMATRIERSVNDLYEWKRNVELKKEQLYAKTGVY